MNLKACLSNCREPARLATRNGWIDNAKLHVRELERDDRGLTAQVGFEEVVMMKGAGCAADRRACFGMVRAYRGGDGEAEKIEIV